MSGLKCEYVQLSSGYKMPQIGLGTWQSRPGEVENAIKYAFEIGYRHIDCAHVYENESEIGVAIKYALQELKIPREEIFITSKLWNTCHNEEDVEPALRKTLENLGLEYLDLYLIHWPMGFERGGPIFPLNDDGTCRFDEDIHPTDTWFTMEKMQKKGLVRSIGVSNFNSIQIQDILDRGSIKPVTNQIECHPYLNQKKLVNFCKEKGITITAYSPLGAPARPAAKPGDPKLLDDPKLVGIAEEKGKTPAQIVIKWILQRGIIVIPKSVTKSRIKENSEVFDFTLDDEDMKKIDDLNRNERLIDFILNGKPRDTGHRHYPFNIEF